MKLEAWRRRLGVFDLARRPPRTRLFIAVVGAVVWTAMTVVTGIAAALNTDPLFAIVYVGLMTIGAALFVADARRAARELRASRTDGERGGPAV